ncbi:Derlin-1 [Gigaspora margarita]|nr:Derlin-1 [Gigaspora margarita]
MWPILLSQSLMMAIIYTWSLYRRRTIIYISNFISFKAVYLPFILLLIDTCFIQYIPHDLLAGIIAGHLYYYLKERYPVDGDIGLLNTPRWLYRIFPQISYRPSNPHKPAIHVRLGFLDWGLFGLMNIFNLLDLRNIPRHNIYDLWNTFNLYHLLNILGGRYRDLRNFRYSNERRGRF